MCSFEQNVNSIVSLYQINRVCKMYKTKNPVNPLKRLYRPLRGPWTIHTVLLTTPGTCLGVTIISV
jgi:hypothetical protein